MAIRETGLVLLALIVTLWSTHSATSFADSSTQSVTVSVIVDTPTGGSGGGSGGGTGGGGSDRPIGKLRYESIVLKIARQTFGKAAPEELPSIVRVRNQNGISHVIRRQILSPVAPHAAQELRVSRSDDRAVETALSTTDELSTIEPCTLLQWDCLVYGLSTDVYRTVRFVLGVIPTRALSPSEPLLWLLSMLWLAIIVRAAYVLGHKSLSDIGFAMMRSTKRLGTWQIVNATVVLAVLLYGLLLLWEMGRAANTTVSVTVVSTNISVSCSSPVQLGTISSHGNTGEYASGRATTCSVNTANSAGYSLKWQITSGSGGTATGKLISENEQTIDAYTPAITGTPETWSVASTSAEWGGRLSSTSTTVSTALWGTDGSSEKWLNVSTGSTTIANRSSATSGSDSENIGFRAEIGNDTSRSSGTYRSTVVFTAITN